MCITKYLLEKARAGKGTAAVPDAHTGPVDAPTPASMSKASGKEAGTVGLHPYHVVEVTNPISLILRYFRCCSIVCGTPEHRHAHTMQLTFDVALSLVLVGATFLGLCLAGEFPASVEVMKYVGTYAYNVAKYSMYLWTGLMGVAAPLVAARALRRGTSLVPALALFYLANASVVVCLGLSLYLLSKGAEMGMEWWMYLISALMIVQRCLYFTVAGISCYSIHCAMRDARVRAVMAGEVAPDEPASAPTAGKAGEPKGEALV